MWQSVLGTFWFVGLIMIRCVKDLFINFLIYYLTIIAVIPYPHTICLVLHSLIFQPLFYYLDFVFQYGTYPQYCLSLLLSFPPNAHISLSFLSTILSLSPSFHSSSPQFWYAQRPLLWCSLHSTKLFAVMHTTLLQNSQHNSLKFDLGFYYDCYCWHLDLFFW